MTRHAYTCMDYKHMCATYDPGDNQADLEVQAARPRVASHQRADRKALTMHRCIECICVHVVLQMVPHIIGKLSWAIDALTYHHQLWCMQSDVCNTWLAGLHA